MLYDIKVRVLQGSRTNRFRCSVQWIQPGQVSEDIQSYEPRINYFLVFPPPSYQSDEKQRRRPSPHKQQLLAHQWCTTTPQLHLIAGASLSAVLQYQRAPAPFLRANIFLWDQPASPKIQKKRESIQWWKRIKYLHANTVLLKYTFEVSFLLCTFKLIIIIYFSYYYNKACVMLSFVVVIELYLNLCIFLGEGFWIWSYGFNLSCTYCSCLI